MKRFSYKLLWRFGWLSVLLLHIPATIKVLGAGGADSEVSSIAAFLLLLTNTIFLLEIVFCPILLLCASRKRMIVFLLIVTLLHAGVIQDAAIDFDWELIPVSLVIVIAMAGLLGCCIQLDAERRRLWSMRLLLRRAREWLRCANPSGYWRAVPSLAPPVC